MSRLRKPRAMRRWSSMRPLNLLCLSSRCCSGSRGVELSVDLAGEVALEGASDLTQGAALGCALGDLGTGVGVHAHAGHDGHVEGAVEASVASAVDPVAHGVPGGGRDGVDACEAGEGGFGSNSSQMAGEFLVRDADSLGQPDGLGSASDVYKRQPSAAPAGEGVDLAGGERPAGIDAEINYTQESDQRVDRRGAFVVDVVPGGDQDT